VIEDDPGLSKDIKMIGIGIADDQKKVEAFKTAFRVSFPLFPDKEGTIYYALGKPSFPSMFITSTSGKVLLHHLGLIEDFDGLLKEIREIDKKQ
jgi:hypothetical protein